MMIPLSQIRNPFAGFFKSAPPETTEDGVVTWMSRRIATSLYTVWDACGRIRVEVDGLDKSNKLAIALLQGGELWFAGATPRISAIRSSLKNVNDFFGSMSLLGRIQDMTGVDRCGELTIYKRTPLKASSISLLTISKTAELTRWFDDIGLLPVQTFASIDTHYLGGIAKNLGQTSFAQVLKLNTLGGVKDTFVALASACAIIDNLMTIANADQWELKAISKICLSILADIGKIILSQWFRWYQITYTFVAIAALTSIVSLSKILLVSYTESRKFELPNWTRA